MGSNNSIRGFFKKADSLLASLSYSYYKNKQFGNTEKASKSLKGMQDIQSISWLLSKANSCNKPSLCANYVPPFTVLDTAYYNDVLTDRVDIQYTELWNGQVYNTKENTLYSFSTYSPDLTSPEAGRFKGIRVWRWVNGVPTMVHDTGVIFNYIESGLSSVSVQYSHKQNAYYFRVGHRTGDTTDPLLIKLTADFQNINIKTINITKENTLFLSALTGIADSLNLIYVRRDANNIDAYSTVSLTLYKTINTTGYVYQTIKFDPCTCNLFLTGNGESGNAVIHKVNTKDDTITTWYNEPTRRNNNSFITNDGKLLVLTKEANVAVSKIIFQEWSTCDDGQLLKETITDVDFSLGGSDFFNLLYFGQDKNGNIFVVTPSMSTLPNAGNIGLFIFDKNYNLKTQYTIIDGINFSVFSSSIGTDYNNSFIDLLTGVIVIHSKTQNGIGGESAFYLDYAVENLEQVTTKCVELTDEEICALEKKVGLIQTSCFC